MYELRDYQENAVSVVCNFIKYMQRNGYVTAPGGSGKSVMIARVAEACVDMGLTVDILARSERLLTQNKAKLSAKYQDMAGIYCASLGEKDLSKPITIASIQSIAGQVKKTDIVLVDEAHEINSNSEDDTQYWNYFNSCGNPRIIGFTATNFRSKSGKIAWGDEIINIPIEPLYKAGYLIRPRNKVVGAPDLSGVKVSMGEYVQAQLEDIYTDPALLESSLKHLIRYSHDRHSCLVFGQSRRHIKVFSEIMFANGMPNIVVDGDTDKTELGDILDDFEKRKFKYLLNCKLLTTGYDMPSIDMIAVLKSTKSKISWEQMLYRGTRLFPGKTDFLVLDMGGNFTQHGELGSPYTDGLKREATTRKGRVCPSCETFVPKVAVKECPDCGYEFAEVAPRKVAHEYEPDTTSEAISTPPEWHEVTGAKYAIHISRKKGTKSLRVTYNCPMVKYGKIDEYLSCWHENDWVRNKAYQFFAQRGHKLGSDTKTYSDDDILWHAAKLKIPQKILVDHSEKYPRIKGYEWAEEQDRGGNPKGIGEILEGDSIEF